MAVLRDVALKTRVGLGLMRRGLTRRRLDLAADAGGLGLIAYAVGWVDGLRPSLGTGLAGLFLILLTLSPTKGNGS